jgi:hypothetical protein
LTAEVTRRTKGIVCSEVHVDVSFRLVDHFFLKLPGADISKKIKISRIRQQEAHGRLVTDVCGVPLRLALRKL